MPGRVVLSQPGDQGIAGKKLAPDKVGQVSGNGVLLVFNDGSMRNRHTQWVAEQRHNRKPVRQGADHGRLRKSGEPLPGAMPLLGAGHHKQYGRANHQSRGYSLVSDQYSFSVVHTLLHICFCVPTLIETKTASSGRSGFPYAFVLLHGCGIFVNAWRVKAAELSVFALTKLIMYVPGILGILLMQP